MSTVSSRDQRQSESGGAISHSTWPVNLDVLDQSPAEIPCRVIHPRSVRDAAFQGFREGFSSAFEFDLFGDSEFVFLWSAPFNDDMEALRDDWQVVTEDLRDAFRQSTQDILRQLRAEAHEQPALFDPDQAEAVG